MCRAGRNCGVVGNASRTSAFLYGNLLVTYFTYLVVSSAMRPRAVSAIETKRRPTAAAAATRRHRIPTISSPHSSAASFPSAAAAAATTMIRAIARADIVPADTVSTIHRCSIRHRRIL